MMGLAMLFRRVPTASGGIGTAETRRNRPCSERSDRSDRRARKGTQKNNMFANATLLDAPAFVRKAAL